MHDPPTTFAVGHGSMMPETAVAGRLSAGGTLQSDLPVALYRGTAFIATTDRLQAVDSATGQITATVTPQGKPVGSGDGWADTVLASAPVLATAHGTETVITPFVVQQTGTGTQADHTVVEVTGVNAATGKLIWRITLRPPHWDDVSSDLRTSVVGAEGGVAVVRVSTQSGDHAMAYGIDLDSSRQTWTIDQFQAAAVAGGSVVGTSLDDTAGVDQRPAGYDLTGKLHWRGGHSYDVRTAPAGPRLVRVSGKDYDSGDTYDRLVDPESGRTVQTMSPDLAGSGCAYDDRSALVCSGMGAQSQIVYGLDASTGKVLWQLPDQQSDRVAPTVTAVWHGRVYGTTDHGPVALDARTGKDRPNPGVAPYLVNESAGLALDKGGSNLISYPASS
ncbi:outer membrane protein assembly factor BamB family protein [Streptomyces sp. NPDC001118]